MTPYPTTRAVAAALAILALATTLSAANAHAQSPCPGADTIPRAGELRAARAATLCLLNAERARHGLPPLRENARLRRAARRHSRDMVRQSYFSHDSKDGRTFDDRIRRTGYLKADRRFRIGENIAWGVDVLATPARTVSAWMQSSGHRRNILTRSFREVGIGIVSGAPGQVPEGFDAATYTTDFGSRGRGSPRSASAAQTRSAGFTFSARRLGPKLRRRVTGTSWHPGCPVGLGGLRYLRIAHWGFDGRRHRGELIVAADAVGAMRTAFGILYEKRFPIRRMRLIDDYGGDDFDSIEADNTSAFNCRRATGSARWSQHAYGRAIDVNPIENPYVSRGRTSHRASRPYLHRDRRDKGMARPGGTLVRAFARAGWKWGGDWAKPKDYQHFSQTGG